MYSGQEQQILFNQHPIHHCIMYAVCKCIGRFAVVELMNYGNLRCMLGALNTFC